MSATPRQFGEPDNPKAGQPSIRNFVPTRGSTVHMWTWIRGKGLFVTFKDQPGHVYTSAWETLPEFLRGIKEGREFARELTY